MSNLAKLKMMSFFIGLYFYTPIFTLYFLGKGISLEVVLLSQLLYSVSAFVGEIPTGIFADRYGQKLSLVIGAVLECVGIMILFLFPTAGWLVVTGVVRGLAGSFISGSEEAILYESTPPHKVYKKEYAQYLANYTLGSVVSFTLAGIIIQLFGSAAYPYLFLLTACMVALVTGILLTIKENEYHETTVAPTMPVKDIIAQTVVSFKRHTVIGVLMIVSLLTLNGEYSLRAVYQPVFEARAVMPLFLGLSLALGQLLHFCLMHYIHVLEEYMTVENALLLINGVIGLMYITLSLFTSPVISVIAFVVLLGAFNTQQPIISDFINSRITSESRSTILSTFSFVTTIGLSLYRIIFMYVVSVFGITQALFVQGVYVGVGMAIGYYLLRRCGCTTRIHYVNS